MDGERGAGLRVLLPLLVATLSWIRLAGRAGGPKSLGGLLAAGIPPPRVQLPDHLSLLGGSVPPYPYVDLTAQAASLVPIAPFGPSLVVVAFPGHGPTIATARAPVGFPLPPLLMLGVGPHGRRAAFVSRAVPWVAVPSSLVGHAEAWRYLDLRPVLAPSVDL